MIVRSLTDVLVVTVAVSLLTVEVHTTCERKSCVSWQMPCRVLCDEAVHVTSFLAFFRMLGVYCWVVENVSGFFFLLLF